MPIDSAVEKSLPSVLLCAVSPFSRASAEEAACGVTVCVALQALHPFPVFVAGTADLQARMRSWYSTPLAANPPCLVKKLLVAVAEVTAHEDGNPPSETLPMPIS